MFTQLVSDAKAFAIDDEDEDLWQVHIVDFSDRQIKSFEVEGEGQVQSAYYDSGRDILWVIIHGALFYIDPSEEYLFGVPQPESKFFMYAFIGEGEAAYVSGEYSNLWRFALPAMTWEPLLSPEPAPPQADDEEEQTRQTREYADRYPPFYSGFQVGKDYVFCGALGALARIRGGTVMQTEIDSAARLVTVRDEGGRISVSADSPSAEIYVGDFETGFELIFSDKQPALHRTALHCDHRFIGIAEFPPCDLHNLYVLDGKDLIPYETGCAREPFALSALTSVGSTLWVVDSFGIFRHDGQKWSLLDLEDLRRGVWPEDS